MPTRTLKLKCYHPDCANDPPLEIKVDVPRWSRASRETKEKLVPCERGHTNMIPLPANWGVREPTLGDDGVIGNEGGTPVIQGRQDEHNDPGSGTIS